MGYQETQAEAFRLVGYDPTEAQWKVHNDQSRFKQPVGGVRGGKSMVGEKDGVLTPWAVDFMPNKRPGLIWLLGNNYAACEGEWNYCVEDFRKLEVLAKPPTKNIDPGEILIQDGTQIVTKSARYPETIATTAPDVIVVCEAGQVEHEVILRCIERLAEKRGKLIAGGTFEEEEYTSWFKDFYYLGQADNELGWRSFSIPTWSNKIIYPGGRNDPEILRQEAAMTRERFLERFGGVPCPKTGRVVNQFSNAIHVKSCPFNKDLPVELAVDPGYAGAYAVLVIQNIAGQTTLIDEIYVQGVVTEDIIGMCEKYEDGSPRLWWTAVVGGAIDIAARQHQAMAAPIEVWLAKGGVGLQSKKVNIEDGIDLLNTHLKPHPLTRNPGILVDPKCRGFISECGGGKSPVENGGIWMRNKDTLKPVDRNNHACKALIYYLSNKYGFSGQFKPFPKLRWSGQKPQRTFQRT